jgi:hypothetical protein
MHTTPNFQRVITAIAARHGQTPEASRKALSLKLPGYMRLCIERIDFSVISVAHYYEQNGDLCADPEVSLKMGAAGWEPLTFQMPNVYQDYSEGRDLKGQHDLADFCETWAQNLEDQGWTERSVQRTSSDD